MRCQNCGRTNQHDASFCDACGVPLVTLAPYPRASVDGPVYDVYDVFIGRQAEMGVLQASLEQALAGQGGLMILVGEPGIGKKPHGSRVRQRGRAKRRRSPLGQVL